MRIVQPLNEYGLETVTQLYGPIPQIAVVGEVTHDWATFLYFAPEKGRLCQVRYCLLSAESC